jgi:hypothetical protein
MICGWRSWRLEVGFPHLASQSDGFIDPFGRPFGKFKVLVLERWMKNWSNDVNKLFQ